jgi:AcrR family transcriptional regulator
MPRTALSRQDIDAFREQLCAVATRRFAEHGFAGVTLRGLAQDLGCSPMTPYRYFRDKGEIFAAVRTAAFARFADAEEACLRERSGAEPLTRLRALAETYIAFARAEPDAYRIMFELSQPDSAAHPDLERQGLRAWTPLRTVVADAVQARLLAGDPDTLAHVCWAAIHGAVALQLAGKLSLGRTLDDVAGPIIDTFIRGAAPAAPRADRRSS